MYDIPYDKEDVRLLSLVATFRKGAKGGGKPGKGKFGASADTMAGTWGSGFKGLEDLVLEFIKAWGISCLRLSLF